MNHQRIHEDLKMKEMGISGGPKSPPLGGIFFLISTTTTKQTNKNKILKNKNRHLVVWVVLHLLSDISSNNEISWLCKWWTGCLSVGLIVRYNFPCVELLVAIVTLYSHEYFVLHTDISWIYRQSVDWLIDQIIFGLLAAFHPSSLR